MPLLMFTSVHQVDYHLISRFQIQPPSVKMSHTKNN